MLAGVGVLFGTMGSASAQPSAGDWQQLRNCESGGNYAINTGNGYYGAYQFDLGTWYSIGGAGVPSDASPATQDAMAYRLWQQRGWSPWACASIVGLPAGGSGGSAIKAASAPATKPERETGHFDHVKISADGTHLKIVGWAADTNYSGKVTTARISINGRLVDVKATSARPDVNRIMHVTGGHGYAASVPVGAGTFKVCVTALGRSSAHNFSEGCHTVTVKAGIHSAGHVKVMAGRAYVSGWAYDNTSPRQSLKLIVTVNGVPHTIKANLASPDVDAVFGIPGNHRYNASSPLKSGWSTVCVVAQGLKASNRHTIGCSKVVVGVPDGHVDAMSTGSGKVRLTGWAFDPNVSSASTKVQVTVNNANFLVAANGARSDVDNAMNVSGKHGFSVALPVAKGASKVCVYSLGTPGVAKRLLSCRTVTA